MRTVSDIRLAFRLFRRNRLTTATALLSIALSVAATSVVFVAVKSVLITPLPYGHPEQLVQVRTRIGNRLQASIVDFGFWNDAQEIARRARTLASVAVYNNVIFDLAGNGSAPPEALYGLNVSANLFPTLGVSPMIGRNILPEEDQPGRANVIILSYGLWVRRFNSDRNIVDHNIQVGGHDCLVIGVMPPKFTFPLRREAAHTPSPYVEFWTPIRRQPIKREGAIGIVARLRERVSVHDAEEDLEAIGQELAREFPATNGDRTLSVGLLKDRALATAGKSLWLLMGAACVFLLIGCANVANLLLARGLARQREMATRIALGARNGHILRQLLRESCVLAFLGGIGGYLLTAVAWQALPVLAPASIPRLATARADWTILLFALLVAVLNGILFGMAPALRGSVTLTRAIRGSGVTFVPSGHDRVRSWLVISEVALAITLVVIGAQLTGKFIELLRTDPGFDADHLLASVIASSLERHFTPEQWAARYSRFLDAVRTIPGVTSAGTVNALPFSGENLGGLVAKSDVEVTQPNIQMPAEIDTVSESYLQTLGVRLIQGRWFTAADMNASSNAAIVSDAAAGRLWPGQNPIGRRICLYCTAQTPNNWKQVIAVVSTIRHRSMDGAPDPNVYLSAAALQKAIFLVVRTNRPVAGFDREIRRAIAGVDPNQPVFISASMRAFIADSMADRRFIMILLATNAALALLMSAAGVYGIVAYSVSRRTQEIGVRMALGASRGNIHLLICRQGYTTVCAGLAIGLGLTMVLLRVLREAVPGLEEENAASLTVSLIVVSLAAALACWLPARRAATIDPVVALREE